MPQPSVLSRRHSLVSSRNFTEDSYWEEFFLPVFYGLLVTGNWIATMPRALNAASRVSARTPIPFRKALGDARQ